MSHLIIHRQEKTKQKTECTPSMSHKKEAAHGMSERHNSSLYAGIEHPRGATHIYTSGSRFRKRGCPRAPIAYDSYLWHRNVRVVVNEAGAGKHSANRSCYAFLSALGYKVRRFKHGLPCLHIRYPKRLVFVCFCPARAVVEIVTRTTSYRTETYRLQS